jgi:hypothetical protein
MSADGAASAEDAALDLRMAEPMCNSLPSAVRRGEVEEKKRIRVRMMSCPL